MTYTSESPVGSPCSRITRSISVWIAESFTQVVHPGPVPSGGASGSLHVDPLPVGSGSVSAIAPPKEKSYAAGPTESGYWPIRPNRLLVDRSAATTRSMKVSITCS
jgi:hypothetical protein